MQLTRHRPDGPPLCPVCAEVTSAGPLGELTDARCPRCGTAYLLSGRYAYERRLGGGGQGQTFGALDVETGERVAVKELSLAQTRDWKSVELFRRQATVLASLRHPAIPRLHGAFEVERAGVTFFYVVTEFIEGGSLADAMARGERFDEAVVVSLAREVLLALAYLHGQTPPIIHRDLKPSNLMRRGDGRLVIIDFGLVRESERDSGSTMAMGTPGYAPLEQFSGFATPATDLYALGATLVALLARAEPASMMKLGDPKLRYHGRVKASKHLLGVLDKLLEPIPEDRYQSAAEVLAALEAPAPTVAAEVKRRGRGRFGFAWLASLAFASIFVTPVFSWVVGSLSGYHDLVMERLRRCPEAQRLLGDDIGLRVFGCMGTGKSSCGGGSGQANFSYPVGGSKGSGDYRFFVTQSDGGPWVFRSGTLRVGTARVDLLLCEPLAPGADAIVLDAAEKARRAVEEAERKMKEALATQARALRSAAERVTEDAGTRAKKRRRAVARADDRDDDEVDAGTAAAPSAPDDKTRIAAFRAAVEAAEPDLDGPRDHQRVLAARRLRNELRRANVRGPEVEALAHELKLIVRANQSGRFPIRKNRMPADLYAGADKAELDREASAVVRAQLRTVTVVKVHITAREWIEINGFLKLPAEVLVKNKRGRYWVYRGYWRRYRDWKTKAWKPRKFYLPGYSPYGLAPENVNP